MSKTHIRITPGPENANVIVCGSPERAEWFASLLKDAQPVAKNREYHSFRGTFDGESILILSHGVGSAGAAIAFREVIDAGAQRMIRIGTAGGLYRDTKVGDLVIPTAAVRNDGVSSLMIPVEYPAVADLNLTVSLRNELGKSKAAFRSGVILTSDLFYPGLLDNKLKFFSDAGVIAVEMECSTLFVCASLAKTEVAAGAIVVLDGSPLEWDKGNYDPNPARLQASLETAFHAAVRALVS